MTRTPVFTRREALFLSATASMAVASPGSLLASDSIKTGVHQESGEVSMPRSAVAKTQYGLVRGFLAGGVFTFKGVPYGQNAGGANRWLPLKPPTEPDTNRTMIFDNECRMVNDPDGNARKIVLT